VKFAIFSLLLGFTSLSHALIIGGVDLTAHDPVERSTAALYSPSANSTGGALCTASLIGKNMAVTAAHCIQSGGYAPVMIFGPNVRSPESVQRPVTGEAVNPAWNQNAGRGMDQGDIAVVKFGGGLPPGYKAAALASPTDEIQKGESAVLAGYGISNASTQQGAGVLRKTTVQVDNPRRGKSEMILDQSHGRGACHGDSGGPAYFQRSKKMVLAGVTNRSYPNSAADDCGHKVVYTKIAAYRPWIQTSEDRLNHQNGSQPATGGEPQVPVRSLSKHVRSHRTLSKTRALAKTQRPTAKAHALRAPLAHAHSRAHAPRAGKPHMRVSKRLVAHHESLTSQRPARKQSRHLARR
jgi:hypothetical protein